MGSTDPYRLGRDVIASTRLNLQHYIWKENIGYLLHPSIRFPNASSNSDISIADVGTGTGYAFTFHTTTHPPTMRS